MYSPPEIVMMGLSSRTDPKEIRTIKVDLIFYPYDHQFYRMLHSRLTARHASAHVQRLQKMVDEYFNPKSAMRQRDRAKFMSDSKSGNIRRNIRDYFHVFDVYCLGLTLVEWIVRFAYDRWIEPNARPHAQIDPGMDVPCIQLMEKLLKLAFDMSRFYPADRLTPIEVHAETLRIFSTLKKGTQRAVKSRETRVS